MHLSCSLAAALIDQRRWCFLQALLFVEHKISYHSGRFGFTCIDIPIKAVLRQSLAHEHVSSDT